ncbi:retropepsin-like aspartic protease family protein [Primorskyibacter sp. S87]|uniref:retropepsin-like aspartic protease family protein n=1 Tax=Primorskyibacter sp. S87 TaxID=3415126 RepID=UPI003C7C3B1E
MEDWQIGNAAYLVILLCAVLFWFVTGHRQSLGRTVQMALAWVLIFVGVIAAIGVWEDIRHTISPAQRMVSEGNRIELPRGQDGHFYMRLEVNGKPLEFLVDTGASQVVLSREDAARIGIDTDQLTYFGRAMTANGEVRTAPVRLENVSVGPYTDSGVRAWVNQGDMDQSLLGMSYLQLWEKIEISSGKLTLTR